MTWFRVDDGWATHRKVDALGDDQPLAVACWAMLGCACARDNTDGLITRAALKRTLALWTEKERERAAAALVRVGLWDVDDSPEAGPGGGWRVHDWLDYQPSRASVEAERAAGKERQRRSRERRMGVTSGVTNADVTPSVTRDESVSHSDPTRPDPTRPDPRESESARAPEPEPLPGHAIPWKPLIEPLRSAILEWAKTRKVAAPREAHIGCESLALVPIARWLTETGDAQGWDDAERVRRCGWLVGRFYAADGSTRDAGYPLAFLARNPQQYALEAPRRRGAA